MARSRTSSSGAPRVSDTRAQLLVVAARRGAVAAELDERGVDARTVGVRDLAARVEAAARGRRDQVGRHAGNRLEVRASFVEVWHRAQQRARVRMPRRPENL